MTVGSVEESARIVIDIDGPTAVFGLCDRASKLIGSSVRSYRTDDFPTATDCIQNFARETGARLAHSDCAISVSGAISGDGIRIQRCKWIISRVGLGYLFQKPAFFLNDSAAKLWASKEVGFISHRPLNVAHQPDFSAAGKWLGINYESGLGAAILIRDEDRNFVHVETEAGHCAFTAVSNDEVSLLAELARQKRPVSWERALFCEGLTTLQKSAILGSFVGDTIMATGSWSGVLLFGAAADLLSKGDNASIFAERRAARANFQIPLKNIPCWTVRMPNINLVGLARYLSMKSPVSKLATI
jgi:glucokinase